MTRIVAVPQSDAEATLWRTTAEAADLLSGIPWVVVGGQMVMLLELEHGRATGRTTRDLDAVVDVRAVVDGIRQAADRLVGAGFVASPEHPYRFERGPDSIDLLAPDHLGPRMDLTTVPPLTTVAIAGGSRALETRRTLEVEIAGTGVTLLPVPSLGGAIALKCAAHGARRARRDLEDLVRLLALVDDVESVRSELLPAERRRLGRVIDLRDQGNTAWRVVPDPVDARMAFLRLADD